MSAHKIAQLLHRTIGLDPVANSPQSLERCIRKRMQCCEIVEVDKYYQKAVTSSKELRLLIEETIIPETWFFRDPGAYNTLKTIAVKRANQALKSGPVRIASMPCSTGEEAYSIAISLFDCGMEGKTFQIDALDVSDASLEVAKVGVYRRRSFRGSFAQNLSQYFSKKKDGWRIADKVKEQVGFFQGNLLAMPEPFASTKYDVIFCRNVLIYLSEENRSRVISYIQKHLNSDGKVFVGSAESQILQQSGFRPLRDNMSFALEFDRMGFRFNKKIPNTPQRARKTKSAKPALRKDSTASVKKDKYEHKESIEKSEHFDEIRRLADMGKLEIAEAKCDQILQNGKPAAEALLLMGFLKKARNRHVEANDYFRKVLYLSPDNQDALLQCMLFSQSNGESHRANAIRKKLNISAGIGDGAGHER